MLHPLARSLTTGASAVALAFALVSCSSSEDEQKEPEQETAQTDPARFATDDVAELLRAEPGPLDAEDDLEEIVDHLAKQIEDGVEDEDLFHALLDRAAFDFRPYQEYLDTFEADFTEAEERPDGSLDDAEQEEAGAAGVNVQVLFDASSSMRQKIDGESKIGLAKEAVRDFVSRVPDGANVSLRAYGHIGSNKEKDKARSCATTEAVYPLGPYDEDEFGDALDSFEPTGFTPIARALEEARADLSDAGGETIVYVVSDGEETCGGNPVDAATALVDTDAEAVVNIIGFDVSDDEQKALKDVAEAGNGTYHRADSGDELRSILRAQRDELRKRWSEWSERTRETAREERDAMQKQTRDLRDQGKQLSLDEDEALLAVVDQLADEVELDDRALRFAIENRGRQIRGYVHPQFTRISYEVWTEGTRRSYDAWQESVQKRSEIWQESLKGR